MSTKIKYVGGLWWGKNVPEDFMKIDADKFNDVIIVSREYFLKHIGLIHAWAEKMEEERGKCLR